MKNVGILYVHGIGDQGADFSSEMHARIARKLEDRCDLSAKTVWYSPIMADRQTEFFDRAVATKKVRNDRAHRFFCKYANDLISYYQSKYGDQRTDGVYDQIHTLFLERVRELRSEIWSEGEITIIAHSLGTIVALDWMKHFKRDLRIKNLFLMGSPKPLANAGYRDYGDPGFAKLDGKFLNFIDRHDPVAWPYIKTLNDKWAGVVDEDVPVNVGGLLTSWNPLCHMGYWTDEDVINRIVETIGEQALEEEKS